MCSTFPLRASFLIFTLYTKSGMVRFYGNLVGLRTFSLRMYRSFSLISILNRMIFRNQTLCNSCPKLALSVIIPASTMFESRYLTGMILLHG